MKERHEWRPLSAKGHVAAAKVPDHGHAQNLGQNCAGSCLMGAAMGGVMRQCLPVKADERCRPEL